MPAHEADVPATSDASVPTEALSVSDVTATAETAATPELSPPTPELSTPPAAEAQALADASIEVSTTPEHEVIAATTITDATPTDTQPKPVRGWRRALNALERMIGSGPPKADVPTASTAPAPVNAPAPPPVAMDASARGASTLSVATASEPSVEACKNGPPALWGHVTVLSVPDVLGLISNLQKTGIFSVWNEREWYRIWLVSGTVVWAQSRTPMPNLMIGQILVAQGAIDQATLAQFIEQRPESRGRLGQALVEVGRIEAQALERAVTFQAQSIFDRAYAMQDASYCFEIDAAHGAGEHGLSVTHLLLESARTSDEATHRQSSSVGDPFAT